VRRLYADLIGRRLRAGDWSFPLRAARGAWRAARGRASPLLGTLVVTYRCDLACAMCDLPRRGDRAAEMDTGALQGLLDALADLGVIGVGITGGEPLLRPDLLAIAGHGARRGLLMHLNTNGTLVTDDVASGLADAGVTSVNVSLDAPEAALHDRLRGRDGSFSRVLRAAARLCAVGSRPYRVALTCAVGPGNVAQVGALLDRARDLGVDRVGLLPVHDFPADGARAVPAEGRRSFAETLARFRDDPLLDNSREYLDMFDGAWSGGARPLPCSAPRTSIVVDCYGEVFACVPRNATRQAVGRVVDGKGLRELWRSEAYRGARDALRDCRACFWNCHTELDLALRRVGGRS